MHYISCKTPLRLAFPLVAVSLSVVAGGAQAPKPAPEIPSATAKATASLQSKNTKLTPPPGKMRGLTNEMRWAAAIRTSDRKVQAQAKRGAHGNQGGGKQ